MMCPLPTMWVLPDTDDFATDVQRLFDDLDRCAPPRGGTTAGGVIPALDVIETATTIDIVIDVPGVAATAVRAVFSDEKQTHNRWPLLFFALWSLIHVEGAEPNAALGSLLGEA